MAPAPPAALRILALLHITCLSTLGIAGQQEPLYTEVCQDEFLALTCPPATVLVFTNGSFGSANNSTCSPGQTADNNCTALSALPVLNRHCFNQSLCQLQAAISVFGDPCPVGVSPSLKVTYMCISVSSVSSVCLSNVHQSASVSAVGVLVSPAFPGPSPGGLACSVTLLPPDGQFLQLDLVSGAFTMPSCADSLSMASPQDDMTVSSQYCSSHHRSTVNPLRHSNLTVTWTTAANSTGANFIVQYRVRGCRTADVTIPLHAYVHNYTYGLEVSFACSQDYRLRDPSLGKAVCDQDQGWVGDLDICEPMVCEHPGTPAQGRVEPGAGTLGVGYTFNFSCLPGHLLAGNISATCLSDGSLSAHLPQCLAVDCGPLANISHGNSEFVNTTYGSVVEYSCDDGYVLRGGSIIRVCQADGQWNGSEPLCKELSCSPLATIPNGQVTFSTSVQGKTAHYSCIEGFRISGDAERQCLESGDWSGNHPNCIRIVCRHPGIPANGSADPHHISDYPIDTAVSFQCAEGYLLEGEESITCTEQGEWTHDMPTCKVVDCGRPPGHALAQAVFEDTVFPQEARYVCVPGYAPLHPTQAVLRCTDNGTWQGALPTCVLAPTTQSTASTTVETTTISTTRKTPTYTTVLTPSSATELGSGLISSMLVPTTQEEDPSTVARGATVVNDSTSVETPAERNNTVGSVLGSKGLKTEAIAGIAAGSVVVFLAIVWILFVTYWKRSGRKEKRSRSRDRCHQPSGREDSVTELVDSTSKKGNGCLPNGNHHHDWYEEGFTHAYNHSRMKSRINTKGCCDEKAKGACPEDLTVTVVPAKGGDKNGVHPIQNREHVTGPTNGLVPHIHVQTSHCDNQPVQRISSASSNGSIKHKHSEDTSRLSVHSIPSSSGSSQRTSTNL